MENLKKIQEGAKWNKKVYGSKKGYSIYLDNNKIELGKEEAEILLSIECNNVKMIEKFKGYDFLDFSEIEKTNINDTIEALLHSSVEKICEKELDGISCTFYVLNTLEYKTQSNGLLRMKEMEPAKKYFIETPENGVFKVQKEEFEQYL